MMFGGIRGLLVPALVVAAVVGLAGCGDDEDSGSAEDRPRLAVATEPASAFANRMAKLLETASSKRDCLEVNTINAHSYVRFACPADKALRKSIADFKVVDTAEYNTGAVVDYTAGKSGQGTAMVLFVAPDRRWGIGRFGVATPPSTKTSDKDHRERYDEAVADYLAAVRERDCDAFIDVAVTPSNKKQEVCPTTFAATKGLAKRIEQNPDVEPVYMGGNGWYGFYSYETKKPKAENLTISVIKTTDDADATYAVLDVAPSPTAADQRETRAKLKKELKDRGNGNPSMEPSSKPSEPAVTEP